MKFVENNPVALAVLKSNVQRVDAARTIVVESDVDEFLQSTTETFDVILADPPYGEVTWDQLLKRCLPNLKDEGIFVMELDRSAALPEGLDVRNYGHTKVAIWRQSK